MHTHKKAMTKVYVALGSNIGHGVEVLEKAIQMMQQLAQGSINYSSFWKTEPVGMDDTDWFTNAVVEFDTRLGAFELLEALQRIERASGRPSDHRKNSPRTLDLDIVSYGTEKLECRELRLPHPRAHDRLFVLLPLEELAPNFRFPGDDRILATHIKNAAAIRMKKLANSTK
jgi:2-amino-4-hydroxy-6-hydroxymethyldihydropteridine diphosphokinase